MMDTPAPWKQTAPLPSDPSKSGGSSNANPLPPPPLPHMNRNSTNHPSDSNANTTAMLQRQRATLSEADKGTLIHYFASTPIAPIPPAKIILGLPSLMRTFQNSATFAKIACYIEACAESIRGVGYSQRQHADPVTPAIQYLVNVYFPSLEAIVDRIPLADFSSQRFGNVSKKLFHVEMEKELLFHMRKLVLLFPICWKHAKQRSSLLRSATVNAKAGAAEDAAGGTSSESPTMAKGGDLYSVVCSFCSEEAPPQQEEEEKENKDHTPDPVSKEDSEEMTTKEDGAEALEEAQEALAVELGEYLKDAFGDPVRLDYGSGHELHFFIFLIICLECHHDQGGLCHPSHNLFGELRLSSILSHPPPPVPSNRTDMVFGRRQESILFLFRRYLRFMRRLQDHYRLEPAGSHGVWGLDDFHHLPYVLGAAQLVLFDLPGPSSAVTRPSAISSSSSSLLPPAPPHISSTRPVLSLPSSSSPLTTTLHHAPPPPPSSLPPPPPALLSASPRFVPADVCNKPQVARFEEDFLYPNMIHWIYTHKSGAFHEHSHMLYDISSVATWEKTFSGMMKMFLAEVLGKFNVVQHFLFGVHMPWNTKSLEEERPKQTSIPHQ